MYLPTLNLVVLQVGKIVLQFPKALELHPQPSGAVYSDPTAFTSAPGATSTSVPQLEATIAQLRQTISSLQVDAASDAGKQLRFRASFRYL